MGGDRGSIPRRGSDDEISEDEDNEILQNTADNDSAIETANLRNFPDLLRLNKLGWNTTTSSMTQSTEETFPPSKCSGAKPKKPSTNGPWPRSNTPPCDRPTDPWRGLGSQDQLMCENKEKNITTTEKIVENEENTLDPIEDME